MKRIIVVLAVSLLLAPVFSQNVTIPDTAFLAALIEEGVDTDEDGQISNAEAEAVTNLDIKDATYHVDEDDISDLAGIEAFINLVTLNCIDNQLTSLDVSNNIALTSLDCRWNDITSLDVSNNTALTSLSCGSNQITSLDVSDCADLTSLSCGGNQLISLVSNNTALDHLHCYDNQLTSLDVSNNTSLGYLDCSSNQLTSLDVSNNTDLKSLTCHSNDLTSLDVSNNTLLTGLRCGDNQLTSLDVSNNTALTNLYCSYDQLTSLDVSNNTALERLYCYFNELTSLDVSNNTALTRLSCANCGLTELDVSNNTALRFLDCGGNQLTTLDISNNRYLDQFFGSIGDRCHSVANMPSLTEICVWEGFNLDDYHPPIDTAGSPNICFDTICDGTCPSSDTSTIFPQFKMEEQISIYPNPTNNHLTIETDNPDCYSIDIHSLNGQLIYKEEVEGTSKQIDMTPFSKGVYFITVKSDAWVRTEKVVRY